MDAIIKDKLCGIVTQQIIEATVATEVRAPFSRV
jgi:hypothetical protein